ncbi:MAG: hypothetical protein ACTJHV_00720, partial [Cellulosimicrobium funkei]
MTGAPGPETVAGPGPGTGAARAVVAVAPWLFAPDVWERLAGAGPFDVVDDPRALGAALDRLGPAARESVDALVISWGTPPLDADLLDRLPGLRLVAHTGASVKPFVTPALWERGVRVTQAGQAMARPVAEVSVTFALALLHQVPAFHNA